MSGNVLARRIRFGDCEVDFAKREVLKRGTRIHVQPQSFKLLQLLLRCPGALVTREEIAGYLWPGYQVSVERCLNTAVNNLRQVLGDSSDGVRFIETRPGLGYVLVAKVEKITEHSVRQQDYLKARYLLEKMTEEDTRRAIAYLESSLTEGRLALSYASLSDAHCELARLSPAPRPNILKAREYADLAVHSDSLLAETHLAVARVKMLFDRDWHAAESAFLLALQSDNECAAAHRFYASLLTILNEKSRALTHIQRAHSIEPLSLPIAVDLALCLYCDGEYNLAAEQCWKILALEPRYWWAQLVLGLSYRQQGMTEEARTELQNAIACSGNHPIASGAAANDFTDGTRLFFGCIAASVAQ